ncbi:EamA family transporter [Nocardioides zeae]|uniref:EamA family transporter n=1 Tax=Nocardioides imazamoxiresistens TaxID=3231893 RepID=A0ABU3PSC5_9ACTN|nr:EamA family transporter [Nocardioides zeae]MDT9592099.1 EamA family transporter [Nocardioides zeae]
MSTEAVAARPAGDSTTTPTDGTVRLSGVALVLGSCVSLQFGAAMAMSLFPVVGSWGTTAVRLAIASLVLLVLVRPRVRHWRRTEWVAVVAFGLTFAGMNGFFYAAIDRLPLGVTVSIQFLGPLALAAALSRRLRELGWVGLALAGMALFLVADLTGHSVLDPLGVALALAAGAFWALYILASHRVGALVPGTGGLAVALAVGALVLLPFGARAFPTVALDPRLLAIAVGTAVLASVVPYTLELAALRRLPRPVFGVLLSLEPVVAVVAGLVLLGQGVSLLVVCAVLLVVAASAGSTLSARARAA